MIFARILSSASLDIECLFVFYMFLEINSSLNEMKHADLYDVHSTIKINTFTPRPYIYFVVK